MNFRCRILVALALAVLVPHGEVQAGPAEKLRSVHLPSVELREVSLSDALDYLKSRSIELDPARTGVNFILSGDKEVGERPVTAVLADVTLGQALWFVGEVARVDFRLDPHAVLVAPRPEGKAGSKQGGRSDPNVVRKLNSIQVPSIEFNETQFEDALQFFREFSVQLDKTSSDPAKRGVNIVQIPPVEPGEPKRISMRLTKVPLSEAIRYACELAGYDIRVEMGAVIVSPTPPKKQPAAESSAFSQ